MKLRIQLILFTLLMAITNISAATVYLNFYADGHKIHTESVTAGGTYTLSAIVNTDTVAHCRDWSFYGWTEVAPVEGEAVATPIILSATITPHTNVNLYAVYTKNTTKEQYGKVTTTDYTQLTNGDYLIVDIIDGEYYAVSNEYYEGAYFTASTRTITRPRYRVVNDTIYYDAIRPVVITDVSADGNVIGINQPNSVVWALNRVTTQYYWQNRDDNRWLYPGYNSRTNASGGTSTQRYLLTTAEHPTSVRCSGGKWAFFDGTGYNINLYADDKTFINDANGNNRAYIFYLYKKQAVEIPIYTSYPGCTLWHINLDPLDGSIGAAEQGEVVTKYEDGDVIGAGITLPSATPGDGTCENWYFYGWTTDAPIDRKNSAPEHIYTAGTVFHPSSDNQTLYAVYQHTGTTYYERITSSYEIENGEKYIITNYRQTQAVSNSYSNNVWTLTDVVVADGIINSADNSLVWTFNGTYFVDANSLPFAYNRNAGIYYNVKNRTTPVDAPFIFEINNYTSFHLYWVTDAASYDNESEYARYINYYFYLFKQKTVYYSSYPHCNAYTVTLSACGGTVKDDEDNDVASIQQTEGTVGGGIELPIAMPKCPEEGWMFEGWVEGDDMGSTMKTQYVTLPAGAIYIPTHDGTKLYAVYKRYTNRYLMLSNPTQIIAGDNYLLSNYMEDGDDDMYDFVLSSAVANTNYLSVAKVEAPQNADGYYIDIDSLENYNQYVWTMDGVYSACTFQNVANGDYLNIPGTYTEVATKNRYHMQTSATATSFDVEYGTDDNEDGFYFVMKVVDQDIYLGSDVSDHYAYMAAAGNAMFVYRQMKEYTSWPHCNPFTVYFDGCGGTAGASSLTEAAPYAGIALPNAYVNVDCSREDWTFAGWATKPINEETDILSLDLLPAGITYHPTKNNATFYAVYLKKEDSYKRVTSMADLRLGVGYIIATTSNKALGNTTTGDYVDAITIPTPTGAGIVAGEIPSAEWRLQGSKGEYVLYNLERRAYLSLKHANKATLTATQEDDFQMTFVDPSFIVRSNKSIVLFTNAKYLGYQDSHFTTVNSNSLVILYFYQRQAAYNSYPSCIEPVEAIRWATDNVILESYVLANEPEMSYTIGLPEEQTDGTFKVMYDGNYLLPCTQVTVTWNERDAHVNVPYVVASNINASTLGGTNCSTCDYVVLPNANLTIDANKTVHNITIYEGGTLTIANNRTLNVHSLILRRDDDTKAPQIIFDGANAVANLKFDEVYFDTRIPEDRFYWLTLPFDGQVKEISYSNEAANGKAPIYQKDYWVLYYNGALRAADANGGALATTYWQDVTSPDQDYTMQAGQGYLLGIFDQKDSIQPDGRKHTKRVMRMTMRPDDLTWNSLEKESSKVTRVEPSTCRDSLNWVHAGWNLIGNPYLHNYSTGVDGGDGLREGAWTEELDNNGIWTGFWILDKSRATDVPYVTLYDAATDTYSQDFAANRTIKPFEALFVQINSGTQINFAASSMAMDHMPAYRRFDEPEKPLYTGVLLRGVNNTNVVDRTGVVLADDFTPAYEIGGDLQKLLNKGRLNLYTLNKYNQELAFNALSDEDAIIPIPVGVKFPVSGEYTFAFDAEQYSLNALDTLQLVDYKEGKTVDLLHGEYTFTAAGGTVNDRFAIIVRRAHKSEEIATDLDNNIYDADKPRKIIRDGMLFILRDDKMYNAVGIEVR